MENDAVSGQQIYDILKHQCGTLKQMTFVDVFSVDEIGSVLRIWSVI